MRRPWRFTATVLFFLALAAGGLVGDRLLALSNEARENLRLYTELLAVAHESYGAEVSYRDLVFASIQGMLRTLDPHTSFLSPKAYSGMREKQQESFYGLGILVGMRNGQLTVMTPIEGTPASRMGIRPGDVISAIEGEPTDTMTLDDAVDRLKGPKDTQVQIEIMRRGLPEPLPMTITRAEIPQTTVRFAHMLDEATGYISISDFSRATSQEVADAVEKLKGEGMQRLVLDLRNNGGGLLDQAIDVADQFVPRGSVIVETRGRTDDSVQSYSAAGRFPPLDLPVVVLVNAGTASAAEIVSGAIQDHDVGLIVGTPTWGKGLVQTVFTLPYGAGLALTTAKYYTPSGRLIQRDYTSYYDYVAMAGELPNGGPGERPAEEPVFFTDLDRKVYGGGGITPDIVVDPEPLSRFEQFLLTRNVFINFAVDYLNEKRVDDPAWNPGSELLARFERWLIDEEIAGREEVEQELDKTATAAYCGRMVRGEILNSRFGQEAQHRALAEGDVQLQTALDLFPQATELLAKRAALEGAAAEAGRGVTFR